ncbi:hypothetical protein ABZT00_38455, partial [Streptomyces sp. NPDC005486]
MGYGEHGRRRPPVVDLADRRALEAHRPAAPGAVAEARRLKEAALLDFGLTESAVASWLYTKCHHQIPTTAVDTAAVVASGDGTCLLLYNRSGDPLHGFPGGGPRGHPGQRVAAGAVPRVYWSSANCAATPSLAHSTSPVSELSPSTD